MIELTPVIEIDEILMCFALFDCFAGKERGMIWFLCVVMCVLFQDYIRHHLWLKFYNGVSSSDIAGSTAPVSPLRSYWRIQLVIVSLGNSVSIE